MGRLPASRFYVGSPGLFTAPWKGAWSRNGAFGIKFPWFAADIDEREFRMGRASLSVVGRRLDAPAPPLLVDGPNVAAVPEYYFITTSLLFPTVGCWETTAKRKESELKFVVLIQ
jgi:hypothetical protein